MGSTAIASAPAAGPHARELLAEFKETGDQQAFEEIVRRYAGMVFGVCLRTTKNTHDAEDATQAVFLSLAAQCKTGDGVKYVGPWLQQVAKRVSLDIKRSKKRREARELRHHSLNGNGNGHTPVEKNGVAAVDVDELKGVLGEELSQLPSKYRLPLILHYFGGMTRDEMARELNCKPATLGVRIHRGREMLGRRLHERGAAPRGLVLSVALAGTIQEQVSDALVARTVEAACKLSHGHDLSTIIASNVLAITKSAAAGAALAAKLKMVAAIVIATLLTVATGSAVAKLAPVQERVREFFNWNWVPKFRMELRLPQFSGTQGSAAPPSETPETRQAQEAAPAQRQTPVASARPTNVAPPQPPAAPQPKGAAVAKSSGPAAFVAPLASSALNQPPRQAPPGVAEVAAAEAARAAAMKPASSGSMSLSLAPSGAAGAGIEDGPAALAGLPDGTSVTGDVEVSTRDSVASLLAGEGGAPISASGAKFLTVAGTPGSTGSFAIRGGKVDFQVMEVGKAGAGSVDHFGGLATVGQLRLGSRAGSSGVYHARGNAEVAVARGGSAGSTGVEVGGEGSGTLLLGDANSTGNVHATGEGAFDPSLVVRASDAGAGTVEGWGTINLGGIFVNNGQAVANGYGRGRTLTFDGFREIINTIENPPVGGTHGWYARSGAQLALPRVAVAAGTNTYTWGESPTDDTIDLVNSARVTLRDLPGDGFMEIALQALDRGGVPPLPKGHTFIGIWQLDTYGLTRDAETGGFESTELVPGGIDLAVRYDDAMAAQLGLDESALKLWKFQDGEWQRVYDGFERHTDLNILRGHTEGDISYFAVSAPEPGAVGLLVLAGTFALGRRGRRRS